MSPTSWAAHGSVYSKKSGAHVSQIYFIQVGRKHIQIPKVNSHGPHAVDMKETEGAKISVPTLQPTPRSPSAASMEAPGPLGRLVVWPMVQASQDQHKLQGALPKGSVKYL